MLDRKLIQDKKKNFKYKSIHLSYFDMLTLMQQNILNAEYF